MTKQVEGNRFFEIAWETSHAPNLWMNVEGAPLEASMYMLCDVLGQGDLCIYDAAVSAKWRVRSRKVPPVALQGNSGALVLRRELAEPIFADVPSTKVRLRPAPLRDAKGLVDDGFVAVETFGYVPLDRDAAEATYSDPDNRHGAHVREVGRAAWGPGREPRLRIFRLLERPHLLFIDAELLAALRTATSKAIRAADPARRPGLLPFPPPYAFAALPPLVAERDKAARAGQAFWELYRGESSPELRRVAVSHPHYAYAVATSIDRGPADDTRAGACRHPSTAALYAVRVDRAAHPDTRRAAEAEATAAFLYATVLDFELRPEIHQLLCASRFWDAACLAPIEAKLLKVRDWAGGRSVDDRPRPAVVERREQKAPELPRFAGSDAPDPGQLPRHEPLGAELRSDIDAFVGHGLALIGLNDAALPEEVVEAVHFFVEDVQAGEHKAKGKEATRRQMALGCVWGEQLHRAFDWQWAMVLFNGGQAVALISPDRSHTHFPFDFVGRLTKVKARENTVALLFNMISAGQVPPSLPGKYSSLG